MSKIARALVTSAAVAISCPAAAAVMIEDDPSFVQPEENVQLDVDLVTGDNMLQGTTNQTGSRVIFTSSTDDLLAPPQGQARIEPVDGSLGQLVFSLADLATFTSAEFNILASTAGMVTLSAFDASDSLLTSLDFAISSNGQNFFGFLADDTTPIGSISIVSGPNTVISSIGQFRVGGVAGAVPEPTTWALLLIGFMGIGFTMRRREGGRRIRLEYA